MVSNYHDRIEVSEGKRHYYEQKKTSLFGSEIPKAPKSKSYHNRYANSNLNTNPIENNISNQNELLRREEEERRRNKTIPKNVSLNEFGAYDKPVNGEDNFDNKAKVQFDQELKWLNESQNTDDKTYPGFTSGFGCGNNRKENRRRSEINEDAPYIPEGASNNDHKNQRLENESRQSLEEAKAYADHLEMEIQKMKVKEIEDKYSLTNNNIEDRKQYKFDENRNCEHDEDSLYKEAENRAKLRELEHLKDCYEGGFIDSQRHCDSNGDKNDYIKDKEVPRLSLPSKEHKRPSASSTHNDYRQYSMEEYMNCRQQLINPMQLKRTTLSGSEEVYYNRKLKNSDSNLNFRENQDSIIKQSNNINSYNSNLHCSRKFPAYKMPGPYSMKTPYATD